MNRPDFDQLRETLRTRPLTADEQRQLDTWFAAHPDDAADWDLDNLLDQTLARLREIEPSSNFNAIVLDALARESSPTKRAPWWLDFRRILKPALGLAAIVVVVVSINRQGSSHDPADTQLLATFANIDVPSVEVLMDYEVIREYQGAMVEPDTDLLLALQ